ncbi:hypothetical protein Leryth_012039 [Lithospermum erythrorhizon]|nr:hypothetical protein Leryth_012039 [Lithospermum erythrorhizon]
MSEDNRKEVDGGTAGDVPHGTDTEQIKNKKRKKGVFSRIFNGIFRLHGDDFEKRLQYISKEEAAILSRRKRRSHSWRVTTKNLIILSLALEVVAVGFAIMTTRSLKLTWQMRAVRVLPMFLLPVLSFLIYSALGRFTRMCDSRDENNLEKLRAERQAKIDELKEKTNYYTTQQLIQRYDPDPAAKAAAASVLAYKLGAESGMKVFMGEDAMLSASTGNSSEVEHVPHGGLRNRKQMHTTSDSVDGSVIDHPDSDMLQTMELEGRGQMVVDHFQLTGSTSPHEVSWISRLAALLVGEDPTQSYAVICWNCHMHNGLARKEDFPYITYYCPHCKELNRPKQQDELIAGLSNLVASPSLVAGNAADIANDSKGSLLDSVSTGGLVAAADEGITSLSSVTAAASSVADIDKDSKGSVVETRSTDIPVAAAGEGTTSVSSITGAPSSVADIDTDSKGSVVDTRSTDSPVAAAGEGTISISSETGAASSVADVDNDSKCSVVDTLSTGSPVAAAGEGSTQAASATPQTPSSS